MMTLTFGLLTIGSLLLLLRRGATPWGWVLVLAALALGVVIVAHDGDFSSNLGLQL